MKVGTGAQREGSPLDRSTDWSSSATGGKPEYVDTDTVR